MRLRLCCALIATASCAAFVQSPCKADSSLSPEGARAIAVDAYIYGYPLVTMEMTRRVMTNVAAPEKTRSPMGQFVRLRSYPDASFHDVTAPNADTLYTSVWLDVGKEPWVLSIPDMGDRYYLFPMLDGWTNIFQSPGKRTTGGKAQTYAITAPGWQGKLPEGVTEYKSPTSMVWIMGRIYCTGTRDDYRAVHEIQDKCTIVPLSFYGKSYNPPPQAIDPAVDMKKPVRDQVNSLDAASYFTLLAELMKENPPSAADAPMVAKMAQIGIAPGETDASKLDPAIAKDVPKLGFQKIMGYFSEVAKPQNGWTFTTHTGIYGTDYVNRALVTAIGLGANLPQDAIYPTSVADASGKPYDGANKYTMHFAAGQTPPVNGFWSLTMYNADYFFVDNSLNRYNVSSRSEFKRNADGSVDLYIQHDNPGLDKEANWLPAPNDKFVLMLRMYWPKESAPSILDGTWSIPAVEAAK